MAYKCREEIVGKRFLSVSGFTKLKSGKISEWGWRSGVIRAASHKDNNHQDLQVLVEYDDVEWHRREWISIYKDSLFQLFLVEQGLTWAERRDPFASTLHHTALWPAFTFSSLVSTVDMKSTLQPVEFLLDRELAFKDYKQLKPFQEWDPTLPGVRDYPELKAAVKSWAEQQDGQRILLTTPSVLVGYRVEVYRAEGTTQWYTAVIVGYNEATRDLTVTDDTVLEDHNEDPALVQMRLIGDGVVESIMRGENVGITPRRSRSAVLQTHHQQQPSRVVRGLAGLTSNATANSNVRKARSTKPTSSDVIAGSGCSPEPPDKGSGTKTRRRKTSESESTSAKSRISFSHIKEDLENKQSRKKNLCNRGGNKKKVLEEATNSKLREVEIRVEDCLQNATALLSLCKQSSLEDKVSSPESESEQVLSPLEAVPAPESISPPPVESEDTTTTGEADAEHLPTPCEVSSVLDETSNGSSNSVQLVDSREVQSACHEAECEPVPVSEVVEGSEVVSEEEDCVIVAQRTPTPSHTSSCAAEVETEERECSSRGDDDGPLSSASPFNRMELSESVSASLSLRFPDDRSDSGVSSLRSSSGDERSGSRSSALSSSDEPQPSLTHVHPATRSPLFIPAPAAQAPPSSTPTEPVRVWRDPNLLLESEPHVRHIHSVQHQSLLMSHPSTPASGPPATSTAGHSLYPNIPPVALMSHLHNLPPPSIYPHPHHLTELWKQQPHQQQQQQRYSIPSHLVPPQSMHPGQEELERAALIQDRDRHERLIRSQEVREIEKHKEKERLEREKIDREREREKHERDLEKARQDQALQNHFEKSLRHAQQKREEDRKRAEQELHQREQRHLLRTADARDSRYYQQAGQRPPSAPSKTEYPPPPAHSRMSQGKNSEKMAGIHPSLQKAEVNMFGYPAYQPGPFFAHEPKNKSDHHKAPHPSGLVVTKSSTLERELPNPPPLIGDMKNTVIVKHDGKNPHHLEQRSIAHSPSPKLRGEPMMGHYLQSSGQQSKPSLYEYRSPTQSPHHLTHAPSPHHHLEAQNLGKNSHHRSSSQLTSPHHQRHSPHPHSQQHPSPELRYRSVSESQAMIYPAGAKSNYPFSSGTTTAYTHPQANVTNSKPKVSSPAPHHIYGKPTAGVPITRAHETSAIPLTPKPPLSSSVSPSPYQQVSTYLNPPPQAATVMSRPPPAHSSRTTSSLDRTYERMYPGVSVPGSGKPSIQHGTSPPTAASAPMPISRSHPSQYMPGLPTTQSIPNAASVQTQPLDLGISSNKYEPSVSPKRKGTPVSATSPVCLETKKRKLEQPIPSNQPSLSIYAGQPQLARVSEPSPLIASAATTITTVVNTAAYRTPTPTTTAISNPSVLTDCLHDISVTAVSVPIPVEIARPSSTDSNQRPPSVPLSISPAPASLLSTTPTAVTPPTVESPTPNTPVKATTPVPPPPPSSVDSEKSNSPGPNKSAGSYPVRHLKKAWLQRHTGEDFEDTTGVVGSGSCVTLPININNTTSNTNTSTSKELTVSSLHSIGSMAVNSISKTKHFSNKSNNRKAVKDNPINGHPNDSNKADDSSSSDQDRGRKSPPKRKPPKVKRKKGGGTQKKTEEKKRKTSTPSVAASESGSESEKESGSEKDSDSGASTTLQSGNKKTTSNSSTASNKEPRKRGRRPKTSKNDKGEEPRSKKFKEEVLPQRDPFRKPPVGQLKKTGESFLQDGPCFEVAAKLAKCRECRWTPNQRSKNMPNIFCRFYAFRRLRYTKNGQLAIAGFSDPHKDALEDDLKLWLPNAEIPPCDLDLETSRFLLTQVGDHFCDLLVQEKEAFGEHMADDKTIAWKRVVQGVREMCDVCETTLFNFHWTCGKCGFVVCLDCYKSRKSGTIKIWGESGKDRDDFSWLLCTNRQAHEQEKLMLTQIIAGDSLYKLGKSVHEMRELWNIEQFCGCQLSKDVIQKCNNIACKEIVKTILMDKMNGIKKEIKEEQDSKPVNGITVKDEKSSPLSWLADVALSNEDKKNDDTSSDSDENSFSTLRELLIRPSHKPNGSRATSPVPQKNKKSSSKVDTLDDVISSVIEDNTPKVAETVLDVKSELKHFVRRYNWQVKGRAPLSIRIMTLTESKVLYPEVPHSWLCDGKLLRLSDPAHLGNYKIFQDQWKRGQPVIVSDVSSLLNKDLWHPEAFARDFGDEKNDLVNCMTGNLVPNQPMRKFWEGFDHFSKRLKDDRGNPMLLKLKDWPPGEDFAEMLPSRFSDLMRVLPLGEYTHRTGRLNLASRLPECFVRPDLGPKMYNAYGSALHPSKGTTNLHLDISDAVNVMVYVGIPKDGDSDEHIKEAFRAIDEAGCDILTRRRVRDKGELPGALWHIYNARDADKIRDLLNKVVVEKGGRLEPHHDPIHDQSCYLDGPLRERLYKEYGVEGYAIVQCLGDAVFIPAGAPHQVRNLHNCIKVAEDFVSPENVSHCFHLTQEFRDLTDTHSNHEDKLQIKNIIYHAVKDSLSSLSAILNKHVDKSDKESGEKNGGSGADTQHNSATDSSEPA